MASPRKSFRRDSALRHVNFKPSLNPYDFTSAANLGNFTRLYQNQKKKWESINKIPDQVAEVKSAERLAAIEAEANYAKTKLGAKTLIDAAKQQKEADKYTARKRVSAAKIGALGAIATSGLKMFL